MTQPFKKTLFTIFAVSLPFLLLMVLELFLRANHVGGDWSLFVQAEPPYQNYFRVNPKVGLRYFGRQHTLPTPANDLFLQDKPDDSYRIVVLGGSTALGFPYGNLLMFSRILHKRLQDTFPEKRIEMVNTALTAVNSWTLLDYTDDILDIDPDLVLIYAGHNEYYGALGVASVESVGRSRFHVHTFLFLNRFYTVRLLRAGIRQIFPRNADSLSTRGTLMQRISRNKTVPYESDLYLAGLEQFDKNSAAILSAYEHANVPVIISELVDNQLLPPLESQTLDNSSGAFETFDSAQKFLEVGHVEEAKKLFRHARDLDAIRFRAPGGLNDIIRKNARKTKTIVAPTQAAFEGSSSHGVIGDDLMIDHLHPSIKGSFLLADIFYETMKAHNFISSEWDSTAPLSEWYYQNWPITKVDTTVAELIIKNLKAGWPFRPLGEENRFLRDFIPQSLTEQLALKVIQDEMTIDSAHFLLADYFSSHNATDKAIQEYDALTHLVYIEAYHYLWRAQAFLRQGKEKSARDMLEQSLAREEIPMARQLYDSLADAESPK